MRSLVPPYICDNTPGENGTLWPLSSIAMLQRTREQSAGYFLCGVKATKLLLQVELVQNSFPKAQRKKLHKMCCAVFLTLRTGDSDVWKPVRTKIEHFSMQRPKFVKISTEYHKNISATCRYNGLHFWILRSCDNRFKLFKLSWIGSCMRDCTVSCTGYWFQPKGNVRDRRQIQGEKGNKQGRCASVEDTRLAPITWSTHESHMIKAYLLYLWVGCPTTTRTTTTMSSHNNKDKMTQIGSVGKARLTNEKDKPIFADFKKIYSHSFSHLISLLWNKSRHHIPSFSHNHNFRWVQMKMIFISGGGGSMQLVQRPGSGRHLGCFHGKQPNQLKCHGLPRPP